MTSETIEALAARAALVREHLGELDRLIAQLRFEAAVAATEADLSAYRNRDRCEGSSGLPLP